MSSIMQQATCLIEVEIQLWILETCKMKIFWTIVESLINIESYWLLNKLLC